MQIWAYLVAIPVFGLMILAHEAGHYLAARRAGIAVAEFSIGFGPSLLSLVWGKTRWSLRVIPLGGYVRWEEEGPHAFHRFPVRARAAALVAGPLANLLLTYLLLVLLFAVVRGAGWQALVWAGKATVLMARGWILAVVALFQGGGLADLSGPVGIAHVTAQAAVGGPDQILLLTAFLSLNIGLFNLLPVPALDGGRLIFLGVERIRRRPLDPHVEGWIHAGGFILLIALAFFTVVMDLLV